MKLLITKPLHLWISNCERLIFYIDLFHSYFSIFTAKASYQPTPSMLFPKNTNYPEAYVITKLVITTSYRKVA